MAKRINKTKEQIISEVEHKQDIEHQKTLVKLLWPFIEKLSSIYDAQTVVNALSGFIKVNLEIEQNKIKVEELKIDISKEKDSEIKSSIIALIGLFEKEKAKETASLLERLGNTFAQFGASQFLKNPMDSVKLTDIVAK